MSLVKYKQKRAFDKTPEPTGGKADQEVLRFVIQKHDASHLHYDFRLELNGVLLSWAVPKGPSTDPDIKRLAMAVEDHPYDYRTFEGIIPKGQYGGGTVIVWDEGTYGLPDDKAKGKDKKGQEKMLSQMYKSGKLHFQIKGKKMKGEWALVKTHGRGENSWLLMKVHDKYVSKEDITLKNKSVISKKTIAQMEAKPDKIYGRSGKAALKELIEADKEKKPVSKKKATVLIKTKEAVKKKPVENPVDLSDAPQLKLPSHWLPMLATLAKDPFDDPDWIYEVKWDGYRALALLNGNITELKSRNDKPFNDKFYPVYNAVKSLGINAILDGEIVVLNEQGLSNFAALQNWRSEADGDLIYYLFDILWLDGHDLTELPLVQRKEILTRVIVPGETIRISENFNASGTDFFNAAKKLGMEGIIAKKANSPYLQGRRSADWLKIKANKRQEVVIGGYTKNEDTAKPFSSLLVGVFENGKLVYTGKIGTGFTNKMQLDMMKQFKPLIINKPPFDVEPDINKPSRFRPDPPKAMATWLKPELVCEVNFAEMTEDGVMRHPAFVAMRVDKNAKDVGREVAVPAGQHSKTHKELSRKKIITPVAKKNRKTLLNPTEETQVKKVSGHELKFTNLGKIYWPKEKVTKRDMINFYYQVAPYMLPYLKGRPMSLNRHPGGITGESFYQKDVTGKVPDWVDLFPYHSSLDDKDRNFLVCNDDAHLLLMAGMGCIEMNPWSSTINNPDNPDWCIIDLDPDKNSFDRVVEAAQVTHDILASLKVPSYPKTSGSTGLHIYIPLGGKYTYEQSKEFARTIVSMVNRELPKFTSIERAVKNRAGKMYLDFLQNRPQATLAAPYSLRPKPGAPVSTPLHWDEVKKGIKITDYNIYNTMDRLQSEGDIFKKVLGKGIDLQKVVKQLAQLQ